MCTTAKVLLGERFSISSFTFSITSEQRKHNTKDYNHTCNGGLDELPKLEPLMDGLSVLNTECSGFEGWDIHTTVPWV